METITTIKGFDHELKCRGFQYEVGKTYTAEGEIKLCGNGFHAIRDDVNPLTVFNFYEPSNVGKPSRYCVVECSGEIERNKEKLCCSQIKIVKEISIDELNFKAQEWVSSQCYNTENGGDYSSLNGGDGSSLNGGYGSSLKGGDGSSLNGGNHSSLNGGYGSSLKGGYGSSLKGGDRSKFCGGEWSAFFVDITDESGKIIGIATAIVDDLNIKSNQWYEFKNGEWTECSAPDNAID